MDLDNGVYTLRYAAIRLALTFGVELSHRPLKLWVDEGNAVLLPDLIFEPSSGLRVGDFVTVNTTRLLPWREVGKNDLGRRGHRDYEWRKNNEGSWKRKTFQIICFAEASTKIKHNKPMVKGIFAVIALWAQRKGLYSGKFGAGTGLRPVGPGLECFMMGEGQPVVLHWIGCLEPKEENVPPDPSEILY